MESEFRVTSRGRVVMSYDVFRAMDPGELYRQLQRAARRPPRQPVEASEHAQTMRRLRRDTEAFEL